MEMLLMGLVLSFLGVIVCAGLFAAATANERALQAYGERRPALGAPRFFADDPATRASAPPPAAQVPLEVLLLQIERHVRLEHAAAESFHMYPTPEALHVRTSSPLVH
jgi:hypothetical protein